MSIEGQLNLEKMKEPPSQGTIDTLDNLIATTKRDLEAKRDDAAAKGNAVAKADKVRVTGEDFQKQLDSIGRKKTQLLLDAAVDGFPPSEVTGTDQ